EAEIRTAGATSSFKGYHGYPAVICTSVNNEIVHGIPSRQRILRDGDIVSIDCGAIVGGWHGDAALTVGVGTISAEHARLLQACEAALWRGGAHARGRGRLGELSHAAGARGPPGGHPAGGGARGGRLGLVRRRPGVHGTRDRQRDAHGPAGAQLR